jgi:hypothetical protein
METMQTDIRQKRLAYRTDLQNALQRILTKLESMPEVEKIILLGSYVSSRNQVSIINVRRFHETSTGSLFPVGLVFIDRGNPTIQPYYNCSRPHYAGADRQTHLHPPLHRRELAAR